MCLCQGVSTLWLVDQSGPLTTFVWPMSKECLLYFDMVQRNKKKGICDLWKLHEIQRSVSISNIYWNIPKSIDLCTVSECFHIATVGLSSCDRDCMAFKALNVYSLAFYKKSLPIPCLYILGPVSQSATLCSSFLSVETAGEERKFKEILRGFCWVTNLW